MSDIPVGQVSPASHGHRLSMDFLRECWTTLFGAAKISDDLRSELKTPTLGSQLSESSRNSQQIAGPRQRYVRFLCQGVLKKIEMSSSRFP